MMEVESERALSTPATIGNRVVRSSQEVAHAESDCQVLCLSRGRRPSAGPPAWITFTEGGTLSLTTESQTTTSAAVAVAESPVIATTPASDALDRAFLVARVGADFKARDIHILDMRAITPLFDYV